MRLYVFMSMISLEEKELNFLLFSFTLFLFTFNQPTLCTYYVLTQSPLPFRP